MTIQHIAIIMDGNSRWAEARHLPKVEGHRQGAEALRVAIKNCEKLQIKHLTVYAFSSENWERPEEEVNDLMGLLNYYLKKEIDELYKNNVKLRIIGNLAKLEENTRATIKNAENLTKDNIGLQLNVAFSYGSRQELVEAALNFARDYKNNQRNIDEKAFAEYLFTSHSPDPDLLIRTGGEKRLSNFLLWQAAYSELYFTDVLWPDFKMTDLENAIEEFNRRERRYGRRIKNAV